jgi:hypothetical protein
MVQTQLPHVIPFLSIFGHVERCDLENFDSPWRAAVASVKTFQKKGEEKFFVDVRWMLT